MVQEQCDLMTGEVIGISDFSNLFEGVGESKLAGGVKLLVEVILNRKLRREKHPTVEIVMHCEPELKCSK